MFLIDRLLHSVEGYSDRDLGASSDGGLQAKCAAELACSLLHHGNAEVSSARCGPIGRIESAAVIADGEVKSITLVLEVDGDGRGLGMANSVRYSLLTDADQVMDAAGRKRTPLPSDLDRASPSLL